MALDSGLTFPKKLGTVLYVLKDASLVKHSKITRMQQPVWATHGVKIKTIGHLVAKKVI